MPTTNKLTDEIEDWLKYEQPQYAIKRLLVVRELVGSNVRIRIGKYIGVPAKDLRDQTIDWIEAKIASLTADRLTK